MVLSVKILLVLFSSVTVIPLLRWSSNPTLTRRTYDLATISLIVLSRLGLFTTIFVIFQINPRSDVTVYYREAVAALHGEIPLVGIHTAYGPLFDEIAAIIVACWHSPVALVLFAVLLGILFFPIWLRFGRLAFTEMQTRRAAAFYAFNPLAVSTVAIAGQNHVGISLLLALSLLALLNKREGWSGIFFRVFYHFGKIFIIFVCTGSFYGGATTDHVDDLRLNLPGRRVRRSHFFWCAPGGSSRVSRLL